MIESIRKAWAESLHPRHPAGNSQGGKFAPKGDSGQTDTSSKKISPNTIIKAKSPGTTMPSSGMDILVNGSEGAIHRFIVSMERPQIGRFYVDVDTGNRFVWDGTEADHTRFIDWAWDEKVVTRNDSRPWKEKRKLNFDDKYPELKDIGMEGYVGLKNGELAFATSDEYFMSWTPARKFAHILKYSPTQPRHPKGISIGGQFAPKGIKA